MRHAEYSAASWQISILAYWHISNLLTMQHYKALFTLGIPIVIGQIGVRYRILIRADPYRGEPVRTGRNPCSGTDAEEQPVCQYTAGSIAHTHHVDTLSEYPPAGATRRTAAFNASLLHRFTDILVVCTAFQRFQAICRWHNRHPRFHVDLIGRKCDEHHRQLHPDLR